jgi:serine/threonine protein phosphatase PrpC
VEIQVHIEAAELSALGDREENQDRVGILHGDGASLAVVVDGMGGHSGGARAAQKALETLSEFFEAQKRPLLDPEGFLQSAMSRSHDALVALGDGVAMEARPRATCAICLVQDGYTYWAHVGDSRIYHLRNGRLLARTRDHSHVEVLLQEGLISEREITGHPMRNYVECCLGGDTVLPGMSIAGCRRLESGDHLLVCSDGLWSGVTDGDIAAFSAADGVLQERLDQLVEDAVTRNSPSSDNTSAVVLKWCNQ